MSGRTETMALQKKRINANLGGKYSVPWTQLISILEQIQVFTSHKIKFAKINVT